MGTLDNIFSKARDVANDVGKKANDMVEISKLKLSVVSLGSDIDKVYQKLGLMIYEMVKSGSENRELVDGCVAEIDALKQKLDEVGHKIDEMMNVRRCDSCGNTVDIAAQFCPMCGSLITKVEPTIYAEATEVVESEEAQPEPVQPVDVQPEQSVGAQPEPLQSEEAPAEVEQPEAEQPKASKSEE